jgi:hypothetical protein
MSENFEFHGPTTFVNKPVDTVIQDFQNTHANDAGQQLAALLRLILTSRDISEPDRVAAARLVGETAADEQVGDEAKSRLAKVGELVSRAADIAGPAARIVESVSKIFG